jgi:beta-mannanase
MFHMHWGNESGTFNRPLLDFLDERGITPLITWEAWRPLYAGGVAVSEQPDFALRFILDGSFDPYIESWTQGLAAYGKPVLLRFGHEMYGDWYPWAVGVNGNTAQEFIDTWQYLHAKFAEAGATNVRWVWTPIVTGSAAIDEAFPGDDYVDFVGMSGFNWGTTQQAWGQGTWESFSTIFGPMYEALQELSDKPIIIAEMASAEQGGNKADWIIEALITELATDFPAIRAIVWFNIIKETDWRIDSSPESLRAFVTAANSEYMSGTLPLNALA